MSSSSIPASFSLLGVSFPDGCRPRTPDQLLDWDMGATTEEEQIPEHEFVSQRLLGSEMLSNHSVKIFGDFLQETKKCIVVYDLLFPDLEKKSPIELYEEKYRYLADYTGPIFIPFILENAYKGIPIIGPYFRDHIVVLTYQKGEWEYYDSMGVQLESETRKILGLEINPHTLLQTFQPDATAKSNRTVQQNDWTNCGAFVCHYMHQRTEKSLEEISKQTKIDPSKMRRQLATLLRKEKQAEESLNDFVMIPKLLKSATCPADITARLKSEQARSFKKKAIQLLNENAKPYLKDGAIDKARVFKQINKDLPRSGEGMIQLTLNGTVYDGSKGKDAEALFQELMKTGRDEKEVLDLMTLLQQGVFASIQWEIMEDLDISGMDSSVRFNGECKYLAKKYPEIPTREYQIKTDEGNILLKCSIQFELSAQDSDNKKIARETPYGILEALVQLDLDAGTASESWRVKEVIE
ncbi:MAG: hypothetical protein KR126chlam3_01100 [Chlamydiae bacterium]|nr:hypothetical protein [Chlamydiota bacterium]